MPRSPESKQDSQQPSSDQRSSSELAKLIRKLRWIGMEEEAAPLMDELRRRGTAGAISVITPSRETD